MSNVDPKSSLDRSTISPASPSPIVLSVTTIEPAFTEVIRDVAQGVVPEDSFWLSCYKEGEPSAHLKVRVVEGAAENTSATRARGNLKVGFEVENKDVGEDGEVPIAEVGEDNSNFVVSCNRLGIQKTTLVTPVQEYRDPERSTPQQPQRITAFDVAPDLSQYAVGFLDGTVFLYPVLEPPTSPTSAKEYHYPAVPQSITTSTKLRRTAKPHVSTITSLQFFPSSRVLLTSSADFSLTILSAEANDITATRLQPARILKAHTRSVTSAGIIGRGRNVISTSLDSTVRLWDVASGEVISSLYAQSPILCTSLGLNGLHLSDPDSTTSPTLAAAAPDTREAQEARSTLVYCGLQDGKIQVFDLGTKKTAYVTPPLPLSATGRTQRRAITAIEVDNDSHLLAAARADGIVEIYDTRMIGGDENADAGQAGRLSLVTSFRRNEAGIDAMRFFNNSRSLSPSAPAPSLSLAFGSNDGLPYVADIMPEGPGVRAELVGGDCDAVRCVSVRAREREGLGRKEVWTAGDDAVVRRYRL